MSRTSLPFEPGYSPKYRSLAHSSGSYRFNSAGSVSVIVNNVFDTIKKDGSAGWPFYPVGYYLPYGREWWLELTYHFGS